MSSNIKVDNASAKKISDELRKSVKSMKKTELSNKDNKTTLSANKKSQNAFKDVSNYFTDIKKLMHCEAKKIEKCCEEYLAFDQETGETIRKSIDTSGEKFKSGADIIAGGVK